MQQQEYPNIGATEIFLSNGMRVCYKCTDFLDDQVPCLSDIVISAASFTSNEPINVNLIFADDNTTIFDMINFTIPFLTPEGIKFREQFACTLFRDLVHSVYRLRRLYHT